MECVIKCNGDENEYNCYGYMMYYEVGFGVCGYDDSGKGYIYNIVVILLVLVSG